MDEDYRAEFELPRDICYLNAAYMSPQPRRVLEAAIRGASLRAQPWRIGPPDFFDDVERLRTAFSRQVGCTPDNIAIVPSAGYGVAVAANNLQTKPGDLVVVMADQFPSNYYTWRRQTLASGADIYVVSPEPGQSWADALLQAVDEFGDRIAVATLEGHHWASGGTVDLDSVVPAMRAVGARVVLDLTQSIGGCPVDVGGLEPDFAVAAGYKWQFCPYGVAFLYVDERYFDGVPIEESWMARDGADDFSRLAEFTDRYMTGARRFDVSEKSSFSNIAGALAALQILDEWGIGNIAAKLGRTNERIAAILARHGFETMAADTRAPHFQGAQLPATEPMALAARLADHGVYASVRGNHLRVAPHLYTDDEDLARFDDVLGAAGR